MATLSDFGIENHHVDTYKANVEFSLQTKQYLFAGKVREESLNGETAWFDQFLPTEHEEVLSSSQETKWQQQQSYRSGVNLREWANCLPLTRGDRVKMLTDPTSDLCQNQVMSRNRTKNRVVILALLGAAMRQTNGIRGGASMVDLPSTNKVPVNYGSGSNSNITFEKLTALRQKFLDTGGIEDGGANSGEEIHLLVSPAALMSFLQWIKNNSSSNVASVQALIHGEMNKFLGFTWHQSIQIPYFDKDALIRPMIAWVKSGVVYNEADAITRVDVRTDKNYAIQTYDAFFGGAVRTNDQCVHIAYNDESIVG